MAKEQWNSILLLKKYDSHLEVCKLLPIFAASLTIPYGWSERSYIYIERRYLTLCAWRIGIWQFQTDSQEHCNNDVHGYVISDIHVLIVLNGYFTIVVYMHIGVGFSVARSTIRAMPEPLCVGRVTRRFPRFFMYCCWQRGINSHD